MGSTVNFLCSKCGYHQRFFIGYGFNYDTKYIFYKGMPLFRMMVKNPEERVRIRDIMYLHPNAKVLGSESRIYHCSYCRNLQENYCFEINYENEVYFPHYYCSRCETQMEPMDMKWLICPDCGSKEMECKDSEFDWD